MDQRFTDRLAVIDVVNRFGLLADLAEWNAFRELFAESIWFDDSDFDGFEAERVSVDRLLRSWREQMKGFEAVQHMITNHCVELQTSRRAKCRAHFRVHYFLASRRGGRSFTQGGTYTFTLEYMQRAWKIISLVRQTTWSEGNPEVVYQAIVRTSKLDTLATQKPEDP